MKKITIILTAFVFIAVLEINAQNDTDAGIQFEHTSWTEIVSKAKAENKLIFLDAFASWCGPCKYMAKNIFINSDVANFYNSNFINAKIDMEKGEGLELAKKYDIKAYPTFLFIDGDGYVLHQACGVREAPGFIEIGELALAENGNTSAFIKIMKEQDDRLNADFMMEFLIVLNEACISTNEPLNSYFSSLDAMEYHDEKNINLFIDYVEDYENPFFKALLNNENNLRAEFKITVLEKKIKEIYSASFKGASKNKDRNEFEKIQRELATTDFSIAEALIIQSEMIWNKYQKNWDLYAKAAMKYVPNYALQDYKEINSIGWTFYENVDDKKALAEAVSWVEMSFEIMKEYSNMDTYAALLYKLGKNDEALRAANMAIELAEQQEVNAEETLKLINKIKNTDSDGSGSHNSDSDY